MIRRVTLPLVITVFALALGVPVASAATAEEIHKDAADCVLDGTYTLQELRAADRTVGADQREYGCWNEPYAAYLRELAAPPDSPITPPTVKPKDQNKNGKIDPVERREADKLNAQVLKKYKKKFGKRVKLPVAAVAPSDSGGGPSDGGPSGGNPDGDRASSSSSDDNSSTPWWLALLIIPLAILAFGAYRLQKTSKKRLPGVTAAGPIPARGRRPRRRRRASAGMDHDGPTSSYDIGPDER